MSEEWALSDKITYAWDICCGASDCVHGEEQTFFHTKDVTEFIQRLKKEFQSWSCFEEYIRDGKGDLIAQKDECIIKRIVKEIDELAGEKLI